MARFFRSDEVTVGERVVVRRKLADGYSDIIGHVVSTDPLILRPQEIGGYPSFKEEVEVAPEELHIIKRLSPRRIRNSDIRAVEVATAKSFPGRESAWFGGWLARAGEEIAERSNSAVPLGHSVGFEPLPLDEIAAFYAERDMPVRLLIPERIGAAAEKLVQTRPGWELSPEIVVMTRALDDLPVYTGEFEFRISDAPDADWLAMYHFRGQDLPAEALRDLSARIDGTLAFGRLVDDAGRTVAITRGTLTETDDGRLWLGYSAVEVASDYRRRGFGTELGTRMLHWGAQHNATDAYLQVISTNAAGQALYAKLGFIEHHRHRYAAYTSQASLK